MERIGDILQGIARGRGRGEGGPLVLLHAVEGAPGERVAHVPISHELYEAWLKLNSAPFRPHQSLALATLRRGEPLALGGSSPAAAETARLLLYEALRANPGATALLLLPTIEAAQAQFSAFAALNAALSQPLPVALIDDGVRAAPLADRRLLITTPEILHRRLLRHHGRAWQTFWAGLRLCCVADMHAFSGVAGTHLAALLLRCARLRPAADRPLQLVATLAAVAGAEAALEAIWPQPWRVIPADDGETPPTTLAVWRGGADRLRDAAALALALQRSGGYSVHISGAPAELGALRHFVGDESGATTIGAALRPADVQILAGYPSSHAALHTALRSGAQGAVLVLGEQMCEYTLAQRAKSLLTEPAPVWFPPPPNLHVFTQHLLCAASELPLTQAEVDAWQLHEIVARLERHGRLVRLPDAEPAWQPCLPAAHAPPSDPYADFALSGAGSGAVRLCDEHGQDLGQLDASSFDRWGFVGAALPPGRSRYRVVSRDEDGLALTLRPDGNGRRTYPLRRCQVAVREELGARALRTGRRVFWGKVTVDEEVYGYRESQPGNAPAELALSPPMNTRWAAHALWFDVGDTLNGRGALAGWSLAAALPLRALAAFTDIVPAYSVADKRLYLVDAQPGGNGLAAGMFEHLEELLELAYDIAMDCGTDTLLEPLARADKDWLLDLLRSEAPVIAPPAHLQPAAPAAPLVLKQPSPQAAPVQPARPDPPVDPLAPEHAELPPEQPLLPRAASAPIPVIPDPAPADNSSQQLPLEEPTDLSNGRNSASRRQPPPPKRAEKGRRQPAERGAAGAANGQRPAASQPRRSEPAARAEPPAAPPPAAARPPLVSALPDAPLPEQIAPPHAEPQPAPVDPTPDASAMLARMRRLREERERRTGGAPAPAPTRTNAPVESRFKPGEKIFCLPYGDGVVRESRLDDGQELLVVDFPDYGELTVDPAVSLVRSIAPPPSSDDDLL